VDLVFTSHMFNYRIAGAARTVLVDAVVAVATVALVAACSSEKASEPPKHTPTPVTTSSPLTTSSAEAAPAAAGVYGDPAAAAMYWRAQSLEDNCGLMSVADVVGEITGNLPTEEQMTTLAEHTPSAVNPGPIYAPRNDPSHSGDNSGVSVEDLPVLLNHYGIKSTMLPETGSHKEPGLPELEQYLGDSRKVITWVNSAVIWDTSDQRTKADHFVVVTGIDTNSETVHLNDPGADHPDERVSISRFTKAWQTGEDSVIFTAPAA
jgi:predicted double-glycine peptidase